MARGRKAQVNYFPSKGGYYCTHDGVRYKLAVGPDDGPHGPTYLAALKEYGRVIKGEEVQAEGRQPGDQVGAVVRRWLTHKGEKKSKHAMTYLGSFLKMVGGLLLTDVKRMHVTSWLDSQTSWNPTTKATALRLLKTALAWSVEEGHTKVDPLAGVKARKLEGVKDLARGASFKLSDELVSLLLSTAKGRFRDYLFAISRTGARPGEIGNAQPMHYDREGKRLIFRAAPRKGYVHKTAKKTDKDRVIYLPDSVIEIIERNISQGCDYLFPTRQKDKEGHYRKYTKDNAGTAMWKLRNQEVVQHFLNSHNVDEEIVICYALRHTYASNAIDRGVNVAQLAVLLGTSVRMLERHYLHHDASALREVFDRINLG